MTLPDAMIDLQPEKVILVAQVDAAVAGFSGTANNRGWAASPTPPAPEGETQGAALWNLEVVPAAPKAFN